MHLLVAGDPAQATGGYQYDARMAAGLRRLGWRVEVRGLAGRFPLADARAANALDTALQAVPAGGCAVLDGLVSGGLPQVVARHAARLRLVGLVHHPLADEYGIAPARARQLFDTERQVLARVARIIVTSDFTAQRLRAAYGVAPGRVRVVEPGTDARPTAAGVARGDGPAAEKQLAAEGRPAGDRRVLPRLLCVATVTPRKGHAVLIDALAQIADLGWECDCIGDLARDPECAARVRAAIDGHGLGARVRLLGVQPAAALDTAYAAADLFVLASWYEGYGMVIAEALRHGLPIVTTTGGALARTLPPQAGLAVAPGDAPALAGALRRVLGDGRLRARLASGARHAAAALPTWEAQAVRFAQALRAVPDEVLQ